MQTTSQVIQQAVKVLQQGGLIALPTETVYGLGADASNPLAVKQIYEAKGRPNNHPLIVHIAGVDKLSDWADTIPNVAWDLCEAFWPGPLTLIFFALPSVNKIVTGGLATIGLRSPQHPMAQAVLKSFGGGIAAPSANRFGHISPTSAADVYKELGNKVNLILDGGSCPIGIESTIIDISQTEPQILRLGAISSNQLKKILGKPIAFSSNSKVRAPGTLAKHYAPLTTTRLIPSTQLKNTIDFYLDSQQQLAVLAYSKPICTHSNIYWVQMPTQPEAYAQQLYTQLRKADEQNCTSILIEQVPETVAWAAIADRLSKAAG